MYRGNKKMQRRSRRLHNEAKDKPRRWWQDEDYVWEPYHIKVARSRIYYKRAAQKRGYNGRWMNDFGVSCGASKRKFHRYRERKPYIRPTKT